MELSVWEAEGPAGRAIWKLGAASHGLARPVAGIPPGMARRYPPKQKAPAKAGAFLQLVPETGVEPATYALRMRRSTN